MTIQPPKNSTSASPTWGRFWTQGDHWPRIWASLMYAHATRSAASARRLTSASSWAKDFTTRTPFTFSSTIVATSARRAWVIHEIGNITRRIRMPTK